MLSILAISKGQKEDFDKVFLLEMAEVGLQGAVAQPKNCTDVMVAPEPNTNLILEQNAKVRGPWCEVELQNDKDAKNKDAKNLVHLPEADDCSTVQVHVLVVDDNFIDRKIVERLVKSASFHVTAVDSGAKALEALSLNNHINLIITDYCMPEMCGYDLLKQVKGEPTSKDIPVVIMSSENVPNRIQSCLEEGAEEFLLKPVRLADVKRLRSYVSSSKHNTMEQHGVLWKKRKFNADGFQVQSPERVPRLGSVTVV